MEISYKNFKVGTCAGQKVVDGETMPLASQPPEHNKSDTESLDVFHIWFSSTIRVQDTDAYHSMPSPHFSRHGRRHLEIPGVLARFVTAIETEFSSTKGRFCYLGRK
ncbi:hypothetical protein NC651_020423 [Populus alba x Populus x berolinensis]|nr:hypothetical protein NC651_020423 [Populus alba x Populus x berolinensis]